MSLFNIIYFFPYLLPPSYTTTRNKQLSNNKDFPTNDISPINIYLKQKSHKIFFLISFCLIFWFYNYITIYYDIKVVVLYFIFSFITRTAVVRRIIIILTSSFTSHSLFCRLLLCNNKREE